MKQKHVFIAIGIFWLVVIGGFIGYKEYTIRTGTEVLLKMAPVDPRDLFRGDYMILNYDISRLDSIPSAPTGLKQHDKVFVALTAGADAVVTATGAFTTPPQTGLYIAGEIDEWSRVTYGIESYFIPENTGYDLGNKIRNSQGTAFVKVSIDKSGRSVVRAIVVGGQEINPKDLQPYK